MKEIVVANERVSVDIADNYVAAIEQAVINMKKNAFIIGENLLKIKEQMEAAGEGKKFIETAEQLFGFKKTNTYNFIKLYEAFGHDQERFGNFSSSQLTEMLTMDQDVIDEVTPEMTVASIRQIKRGASDGEQAVPTVEIIEVESEELVDGCTREQVMRKFMARYREDEIIEFFESTNSFSEKQLFLKELYGHGGGTFMIRGNDVYKAGHYECDRSAGVKISGHDGNVFMFTWSEVARIYTEFFPPEERLVRRNDERDVLLVGQEQDHQVTNPDQPAATNILTAEPTFNSDYRAADHQLATDEENFRTSGEFEVNSDVSKLIEENERLKRKNKQFTQDWLDEMDKTRKQVAKVAALQRDSSRLKSKLKEEERKVAKAIDDERKKVAEYFLGVLENGNIEALKESLENMSNGEFEGINNYIVNDPGAKVEEAFGAELLKPDDKLLRVADKFVCKKFKRKGFDVNVFMSREDVLEVVDEQGERAEIDTADSKVYFLQGTRFCRVDGISLDGINVEGQYKPVHLKEGTKLRLNVVEYGIQKHEGLVHYIKVVDGE